MTTTATPARGLTAEQALRRCAEAEQVAARVIAEHGPTFPPNRNGLVVFCTCKRSGALVVDEEAAYLAHGAHVAHELSAAGGAR